MDIKDLLICKYYVACPRKECVHSQPHELNVMCAKESCTQRLDAECISYLDFFCEKKIFKNKQISEKIN